MKGLIAGHASGLAKGRVLRPWEGIVEVDSKSSFLWCPPMSRLIIQWLRLFLWGRTSVRMCCEERQRIGSPERAAGGTHSHIHKNAGASRERFHRFPLSIAARVSEFQLSAISRSLRNGATGSYGRSRHATQAVSTQVRLDAARGEEARGGRLPCNKDGGSTPPPPLTLPPSRPARSVTISRGFARSSTSYDVDNGRAYRGSDLDLTEMLWLASGPGARTLSASRMERCLATSQAIPYGRGAPEGPFPAVVAAQAGDRKPARVSRRPVACVTIRPVFCKGAATF